MPADCVTGYPRRQTESQQLHHSPWCAKCNSPVPGITAAGPCLPCCMSPVTPYSYQPWEGRTQWWTPFTLVLVFMRSPLSASLCSLCSAGWSISSSPGKVSSSPSTLPLIYTTPLGWQACWLTLKVPDSQRVFRKQIHVVNTSCATNCCPTVCLLLSMASSSSVNPDWATVAADMQVGQTCAPGAWVSHNCSLSVNIG